MSAETFIASLVATLGSVGAALLYLRAQTRRVLRELCESEAGADFWLRASDVLAMSGSLVLVLAFGAVRDGAGWIEQMRLTLGLAMAGLFIAVFFVASSIWRNVDRAAVASRADTKAPS